MLHATLMPTTSFTLISTLGEELSTCGDGATSVMNGLRTLMLIRVENSRSRHCLRAWVQKPHRLHLPSQRAIRCLRKELVIERPFHNLPQPNYGDFVGRETELKDLKRLLLPYPKSGHAVITILGVGGVGKSSLGAGNSPPLPALISESVSE